MLSETVPCASVRSAAKPFTFNAALDPDVATAAINLLRSYVFAGEGVGGDGEAKAGVGEREGECDAGDAAWGVVNACAGSGTCMLAALDGGAAFVHGVDVNPLCVQGSLANIDYFGFSPRCVCVCV